MCSKPYPLILQFIIFIQCYEQLPIPCRPSLTPDHPAVDDAHHPTGGGPERTAAL